MLATLLLAVAVHPPLTLPDAVSYALDHNPTIKAKVAAVAQAQSALATQRGVAFPQVTGQLQNSAGKSMNYGGNYAAIGLSTRNIFSQNTAQIGTQYTLQSGGVAFLQLASARAQLAQAQDDLASSEDQIATTITNAYYSVAAKQALVELDRSDLEYQDALVNASMAKENAGLIPGVDVLRAQVAQAKSRSTLLSAQADVDTGDDQLALAIGAPLDTAFAVTTTIPQPSLPTQSVEKLEAIALDSRPDVATTREAVAVATFNRKVWDKQLYPSVQITAGFGNQYSTVVPVVVGPGQVVDVHPPGTPGFWSVSALSTFSLPFVDYGARHFSRLSDDAALANAQTAYAQSQLQVRADVRQAYRAAETAFAQASYATDEARLGAESARVAQLQYKRGLIAITDVFQTQQQSIVAQDDLVAARVAYVNAIVKLRVSLGIYDARSAVADLR
jgi:outer membrane protein